MFVYILQCLCVFRVHVGFVKGVRACALTVQETFCMWRVSALLDVSLWPMFDMLFEILFEICFSKQQHVLGSHVCFCCINLEGSH